MEDRWHAPEEPTDQDSETSRKKRRGTDFLSQYLLRRKEQQGEKAEEDDDDETEEKPRKFRRFFKNLFKNVVEPPEGSDEHTPRRFSLEALFSGSLQGPEVQPKEQDEPVASTESSEISYRRPEAPEPVSTPESTPESPERPTNVTEPRSETAPIPDSEPNADVPSEEREVASAPERTPERRVYDTPDAQERFIDRTVYERAQQPAEKEVVIERGPGMALPVVLVGAEYLARKKADRKLDAKYDERVTKLETDNKRGNVITEELNSLVKQNKEQLEALKRDRGIVTPTPERRQPLERLKPRIEQKPQPRPLIEQQPKTVAETGDKPETYKIMEQVAEAAEHDVPVERVFERSHEVKDDQSVPIGAASVGSIMATKALDQRALEQRTASRQTQDVSGLPVIADKSSSTVYKQAMRSGFWAAVIIIILGTIAYLLK